MKRIFVFLLIFSAGVGIVVFANQTKKGQQVIGSFAQENGGSKAITFELNFKDQDLAITYQFIEKPEKLILIPNFDKKEIAKDVYDREKCKLMTNAGFYSLNNKPIGLFIASGVPMGQFQNNLLINGVFSVNFMTTPRITTSIPRDPLTLAIQSGPILKENGSFKNLSITDDKQARRVIVAVTGENKGLLMAIYKKDSEFEGPLLEDVPKILSTFEEKTKITLADALNLDGGTASTFYSDNFSLTEVTPVGSFFCEKN